MSDQMSCQIWYLHHHQNKMRSPQPFRPLLKPLPLLPSRARDKMLPFLPLRKSLPSRPLLQLNPMSLFPQASTPNLQP